jgi:ABC-type multidrug transport system fused ATPase/permease subunit
MNKLILLFKIIQLIGVVWITIVDWRLGLIVFGIILLEIITSKIISGQYHKNKIEEFINYKNKLKEEGSEDNINEYFKNVTDEQLKKDVNDSGYSFFKNIKEKSFSKDKAVWRKQYGGSGM